MKKSARTRTIKTSCELPAGAGKFPPVTRGNHRQSLPAEIFACIRRYFYLRISLPAAFAGNFARASFTVYFDNICEARSDFFQLYGCEVLKVCKRLTKNPILSISIILLWSDFFGLVFSYWSQSFI